MGAGSERRSVRSRGLWRRATRHRGGYWLFCHVMCQCIGLFLATIGLVLALANFDHYVFRKDATIAMYAHGVIGCVLMAVGLLQPLNALLRPHTPAEGHSKTKLRTAWEWLHKSSGYFVLLIAIGQMALGVTLTPETSNKRELGIG